VVAQFLYILYFNRNVKCFAFTWTLMMQELNRMTPYGQGLPFFAAVRKPQINSNGAGGGSYEICHWLHKLGIVLNRSDNHKQTPLFYAAREGNLECALFLIKNGCDAKHVRRMII
jgi:hypothetical protein